MKTVDVPGELVLMFRGDPLNFMVLIDGKPIGRVVRNEASGRFSAPFTLTE